MKPISALIVDHEEDGGNLSRDLLINFKNVNITQVLREVSIKVKELKELKEQL